MKPVWIVLISVLASGGLVGGGTYYLANAKAIKDKNALSAQIQEKEAKEKSLQYSNNDLTSKLAAAEAAVVAKSQSPAQSLTHTNELGKFSFDLPEGYIVSKSGNCEGMCGETLTISKLNSGLSYSDMAITIRTVDYTKPISLESWNTDSQYSPIGELGDLKVGGITAKKYNNGGLFDVEEIRFTRGNFTYEIIKEGRVDGASQKAAYDKILSTFKFTS